jgi:glycerol-3-phosphate dehydrogenase (NAD(P)+)
MEQALSIASTRENSDYLPGFKLPHSIQIGCELTPVLMEADVVMLACPSKALRALCQQIANNCAMAWQLRLFVVMCKGLELESFKTPAEIVNEFFPDIACGVLSGPTFAGEVAAGKPTAVSFAIDSTLENPERYQDAVSNESLRAYLTTDVAGTELGGALKNIYAIASGLCDGLQLGDNAKAALLTRSLNEMVQLGVSLGGERASFYGLSGFGDLVATCSGSWSRNRTFGAQVGEGATPAAIIEKQKTVVEGYRATEVLAAYCAKKSVDAPILGQIYAILYDGKSPAKAITTLMQRDLKRE